MYVLILDIIMFRLRVNVSSYPTYIHFPSIHLAFLSWL